ncbi:hypothetical protein BROUX41_000905 [Berkeleyomyces rouxiae]|uniref:uncharacterized protein n=1 Tax=Berkeleyomyces rouxiae TaxID=2035830 RepID=UPI003B826C5D
MFRRAWEGLPQDLVFSDKLQDIGYFINDADEVRSRDNPNNYFKFSLSKSDRVNQRQRFHFHGALRSIIINRLHKESLETIRLPLTVKTFQQPHVQILVSRHISQRQRVVLFLGESLQNLGVLSFRIVGGRGGINEGSLVSLVQGLANQNSDPNDPHPPGIIVANLGENWWWPEGKKALSSTEFCGVPLTSAAYVGREHDEELNTVPQLETWKKHLRYLIDTALPSLVAHDALIDVIAVGDAVDGFLEHLNNESVWTVHKHRLNACAFMGGAFYGESVKIPELKAFLANRCRTWIVHQAPINTPLLGSAGIRNPAINSLMGCPVYSSGEIYYNECSLTRVKDYVIEWLYEVSRTPDYKNPDLGDLPVLSGDVTDAEDEHWAVDADFEPHYINPSCAEPDTVNETQTIERILADYRQWNRLKLQEVDEHVKNSESIPRK